MDTYDELRNLSEDEVFNRMYEQSVNLYGLSAEPHCCGKGKIQRWKNLLRLWEEHASTSAEKELFYPALHKILWGIYPQNAKNEKNADLLMLLEVELLRDGCAFRAWKKCDAYRRAFWVLKGACEADKKYGPRCHTKVVCSYMSSYLWHHVVYKKKAHPMVDIGFDSDRTIHAARTQEQVRFACEGYEAVIRRLISESADWERSQWADDKVVFRCLKKNYGIDYMRHGEEYDSLVFMLMGKWFFGLKDVLKEIVQIKVLPYSLAEMIWPENTKGQIVDMFLDAVVRAKRVEGRNKNRRYVWKTAFTYESLKESWLYQQVFEWVNDGTLENGIAEASARKAKLEIFNLNVI